MINNNYYVIVVKMRVRQCFNLSVFISVLLICRDVCGEDKNGALEDNTNSIFGIKSGIIAAYGDFNADQNTDVFVINPASADAAPKVSILIWQSVEPYLQHQASLVLTRETGEVITSVVPGDYDGDSKMDVLLTIKNSSSLYDKTVATAVYIYWGNLNSFDSNIPTVVSMTMADQPLIMDYNADMIPDIFGVNAMGQRTLWTQSSSGSRNFTEEVKQNLENGNLIRIPHSNAFLDLNSDYATDIFITLKPDQEYAFEVWINSLTTSVGYINEDKYSLPSGSFPIIGQSTFTDVDADGTLEHLLPVCLDEHCRRSAIYIRQNGEWSKIINFEEMHIGGQILGFVPPGSDVSIYADVPITLSIGDFNTDRYPDMMIVMRNQNDSRQVVLMQNDEGSSFVPVSKMGDLGAIQNPIIATFVDLSQNIMLDMFVVSQQTSTSLPNLHAVKNNFEVDAYFIRVQVLSGLCFDSCPGFDSGTYPYGVNQPGPTVHYETTGTSGDKQYSTGAQLSQSAYYSLQLPSVFMGLGQSPNFVDEVTVGIPTNDTDVRKEEWTSIIPNSILIVIPEPPTDPSSWEVKLLITPGQSVYLTAGALLGTCLFVAFIIGILHFKERREDDKEKRQESHRFHFDAM